MNEGEERAKIRRNDELNPPLYMKHGQPPSVSLAERGPRHEGLPFTIHDSLGLGGG